ncbi:probable E3 ubiquitin-protein ligase MARCHF10 [Bufo bufo]|uniref:probable E3 ubiquitin-protein ligase MARCHF10 n=1 Tax=Bufo bufo TaxID=8384 RepID=UPI001ABEB967|nr:probable E3 ubiquitin-protein ligase MARCHF10 [Bufo bufo]
MDKNWDRHRSLVNGHHMKDVQQQMDSEYKAHLRHQERVRENTERLRDKRAASQHTPNVLNFYSTRSYSKPWQNGMTTKTEISAVSGLEERQNRERQYKSTVSKLPAIKKDKYIISKRTVYNPQTAHEPHTMMTVSQPRITVEKKRLHVHQISAKPSVTRMAGEMAVSKNALNLQSKAKMPKRPVKNQKQILKKREFTIVAFNDLNSTQNDYHVDHHGPPSSLLLNSHELTEEPQTNTRPSSFSWSHLQETEDEFNGQTQRNTNEDDDTFHEDDLSCISDITLPLPIPIRAQTPNTSLYTVGSNCTDSADEDTDSTEEDSSDNEEHSSTLRQEDEVSTEISHSTLHGLDVSTANNSYFGGPNLGPLQASRQLQGISPTVTAVSDQSPSAPLNLRDTVEVPRSNTSITLSQIHEVSPNANMHNRENPELPQNVFRDLGGREMDRQLSMEYSANSSIPAPPRLSMTAIAPNIILLRENLDLVFHTLSMQRQSERRNLENIVPISQNKDFEKPKTDPEKLKKLKESILQEDSEEEEGDLCRICLMGGETTENHLIAPCQCSGSLKCVHTECMKKWLLAKIKSGAELNTVRTCEMCKQKVECEIEGFNLNEHYRRHQETQATLNPSLYLALLLQLYQQRYEELLRLSNTRDSRVSELSRRFLHLSLGTREHSRDNEQDS